MRHLYDVGGEESRGVSRETRGKAGSGTQRKRRGKGKERGGRQKRGLTQRTRGPEKGRGRRGTWMGRRGSVPSEVESHAAGRGREEWRAERRKSSYKNVFFDSKSCIVTFLQRIRKGT